MMPPPFEEHGENEGMDNWDTQLPFTAAGPGQRCDLSALEEADLRSALSEGLRHRSAPTMTPVVFTLPSGGIALGECA